MEREVGADDLKALLAGGTDVVLLDVRRRAAMEADPRLIEGARWQDPEQVAAWADELPRDRLVVVYCVHGHEVSAGVVDRLRELGVDAALLKGGLEGWKAAGGRVVAASEQPSAGTAGPSHTDAEVNEASEESFPASDPPSFTPQSGAGRPERD